MRKPPNLAAAEAGRRPLRARSRAGAAADPGTLTIRESVQLTVRTPEGNLVADVHVDFDCPFARAPGSPPGFVMGSFVPGPAFARVRALLDDFGSSYATGDLHQASVVHEELDRLQLVAIDEAGRRYQIFNVHFASGGLLFAAI